MCGFTGVLGVDAGDESALRHMITTLHHRGPDNQGVWYDKDAGIGFAFARLSILDLSPAGHQPMVSASGRYVIVFNGEIYNHLEIRAELERGKQVPDWRGHSDTETLLAGFEAWGIESTVKRTVGMFAFAVWNRHTRSLTLARDRFGEKPLYYGWQGKSFLFGSELKALKAHPSFHADLDRNALTLFMRYSYIVAPHSIYKGIRKLLPGTLLSLNAADRNLPEPVPYWSLLDVATKGLKSPLMVSDNEALDGLETRLSASVSGQQISDVPLGAFLSGGIDSSAIVALMQAKSVNPIHTFTIGYNEEKFNEAVYAKEVARHLGTDHTEWYVSPEEALSVIPKLPILFDEPLADSSQIPTFLVSQLARRSVTVSLSGDAGDELFGGYGRYLLTRRIAGIPLVIRKLMIYGINTFTPAQWDRLYTLIRPALPGSLQISGSGDKIHKLAPILAKGSAASIYKRITSIWDNPEELVIGGKETFNVIDLWDAFSSSKSMEDRMMALDAQTYLPDDILCKVDRAAMGVSLESRAPFLDHRVVEYSWTLPLNMKIRNGQSKWILRQLLNKYVPEKLINRPKMGFGVPIDTWLRGPLREWADGLINEARLRQEGYFNPIPIRLKWAEHLSGKRNWPNHLWNVLMFQAWLSQQKEMDRN